jgi:hypothetical protein
MKSKPWLPYVAPFAIYVLFLSAQTPQNLLWLYPGKTLAAALALWVFRKKYHELRSQARPLILTFSLTGEKG